MTFTIAPGATPINDLSDLKIPITLQSELDAAEFDNIHRAEEFYFKRKKLKDVSWFTPLFLQQIHKAMFNDVWEWAGKYRKQNVIPVGVEPYKIPMMVLELTKDVAYWVRPPTDMKLLEISARIHQRLAWIHPFSNGNGRFSRFVSNLFLFSYRRPLPIWPSGLGKETADRQHYLNVLQEGDKGNFQPLVEYLKSLGAN
jgi:Fic-DOC domain mobile mystery protein B